ncbi:hypothetical protein IJ425_08895 [bacterium]|nr:hypothetical protein [bacterium]
MKIISQHNVNLYRNIAQNQVKYSNQCSKSNDMVSFCANLNGSNRTKKAKDVGYKIYELTKRKNEGLEQICTFCKKDIPILEMDYIENLPRRLLDSKIRYNAYTLPSYGDDCSLDKVTMYIPKGKLTPSKISSIVHEYVHCEQAYQDESYMGLFDITGGDLAQTRALNSMSNAIFNNMQAKKTKPLLLKAHLGMLTKKDDILAMRNAMGCKNDDDLKHFFLDEALKLIDSTIVAIINEPDVDEFMPLAKNPKKLRKIILEQCKIKAMQEKEAYLAQKEFLQDINAHLSIENRTNPIFYETLVNALSSIE